MKLIQAMFEDLVITATLNGVRIEVSRQSPEVVIPIDLDFERAAELINALISECRGDNGISIAPSALEK